MKKYVFVFAFVFVASLLVATVSMASPQGAAPEVTMKQVAVAPADMAEMQLPNPADTGVRSRTAMIPVEFVNGRFSTNIAVDSTNSAIMIMSPDSDSWTVQLDSTDINRLAVREEGTMAAEGQSYTGDLYRLKGMDAGNYQLDISGDQFARSSDSITPAGYIIVSSDSDYRAYAHLTSHNLLVGNKVGLTAYAYDVREDNLNSAPTAVSSIVEKATMHITYPSGKTQSVAMAPAADGTFSAEIEAVEAGEYTAQVELVGMNGKRPFVRTSEHIFPIIQSDVTLLSRIPQTRIADGSDLSIEVEARLGREQSGDLLISAEVWGSNGKAMAPVAWISSIVTPQMGRSSALLPLTVDGRWFALAGVDGNVELRNIRVQDVDTFIPVSQLDSLPVRAARLPATAKMAITAVSDDMLMGTQPEAAAKNAANYVGGNKLMLVHGYCSSPVWSSSQFTGDVLFQDYNQNRSHNDFATRIRDFGNNYDSFGVVAHSQGGPASVHLYTYYWSGLDYSSGSRLIQSVGSPYQGTALAGNLAALGEIFGAGCGTNWDLTYDGAALWLSNIPSWARSRTYYYTTSFEDNWWSYDYCHIATDLFLDDPDDGTTEKWAGQLSGAHNMGHKTGWCHTLSMSDPGQTTDSNRNSTMNAYANR